MEGQETTSYSELRRAIRVAWERPVLITQPVQAQGLVIDASALGLLVRVEQHPELRPNGWITLEIPRSFDGTVLCRQGRIVRVDRAGNDLLLGIELL